MILMKFDRISPVDDEDVIMEFHPSKIILGIYLGGLAVALVAIITILIYTGITFIIAYVALVVVFAGVGWVLILNWTRTVYYFTNRRIKSCYGLVGSSEQELTYDDVQSVEVNRTFWGAILGFGTIVIEASGQARDVVISNIQNPKDVAQKISMYATGEKKSA